MILPAFASEMENRLLMNERDAAKVLALSPRTLWSMRRAGEIAHVRRGRTVRYDVDDLRDWVKRNKTPPLLN